MVQLGCFNRFDLRDAGATSYTRVICVVWINVLLLCYLLLIQKELA